MRQHEVSISGKATDRRIPEKMFSGGERGPWPPNFGPRLISTAEKGVGFLAPLNIWSCNSLLSIRNICGVLWRFVAFCGVLRFLRRFPRFPAFSCVFPRFPAFSRVFPAFSLRFPAFSRVFLCSPTFSGGKGGHCPPHFGTIIFNRPEKGAGD